MQKMTNASQRSGDQAENFRTKARYSRSLKRTRKNHAGQQQQQQQQPIVTSSTSEVPIKNNNISSTDVRECNSAKGIMAVGKPLLVLDVNGILCRRVRRRDDDEVVAYRSSLGHVALTDIVPRTDLNQFLLLLDSHFTLAVWSSAKQKTLKKLIQMLFPLEISKRLLFVWGQERCDITQIPSKILPTASHDVKQHHQQKSNEDGIRNIIFTKSLAKVFHSFPCFNESNTILIDDSPDKCPSLYRKNALHPPSISGLDNKTVSRSTTAGDDDESNQQKQTIFFRQLAIFWKTEMNFNDISNSNELHNFLHREGRGHMGWTM